LLWRIRMVDDDTALYKIFQNLFSLYRILKIFSIIK
jgi:hypothetical protein